ncbi:MAG: helix-turn-helix domain-containing protein, partial [Polyangiaceae bacterium]
MNIKPIHTEADHEKALREIERLWNAKRGSVEHDKLEVLSTLVDAYEREHVPILPPDPISAIVFRMEQQGLKRNDLLSYFGTRARVSEVLARKRTLTLAMIRALHAGLGIPADVLLAAPPLARR